MVSNQKPNDSLQKNESQCKICAKIFASKHLLDKHFGTNHKNYLAAQQKAASQNDKTKRSKPQCEICEKTFSKADALNIRQN